MKRIWSLALLFACTEPQRLPVDVGPRDAGADAGQAIDPDAGSDAGSGDSGVVPTGICAGKPCLTAVATQAEWDFVSGPARSASRCDLVEEVFFVLPRTGAAIPEPLYVDAERYDNLYFFLREHLSAELPDLDPASYYDGFERSDRRTYWTGRIFRTDGGGYAFDLVADFYFGSQPGAPELDQIRVQLGESFAFPLGYAPQTTAAIGQSGQFPNPPFTLLLPEPCAGEGCGDPNALCVVIPEGSELCGHFAEGRSVAGELANKIRLQIVPGSYAFRRQVGSMPLKLFGGGTFGADRTPLDATADGLLTIRELGGYLYFDLVQTLTAGAQTIEMTWSFYDLPTTPQIFREPFLSDAGAYGLVDGLEQIVGRSCSSTGLGLYFAEGHLAGGDSFRFAYRHQIPGGGSGPLLLTHAEVTLGGQRAQVDDYFRLVYAGLHHNWDNQFVVIFDQPLTYSGHDVYGIWIDEPGIQCCPVDSIYTLDSSYQKLDPLQVVDYVRAPVLF